MPVPVSPSPAVPRTDTADYKPQYLDGFPTPQVGDSSMGVIDTMAVMEVPAAGQASLRVIAVARHPVDGAAVVGVACHGNELSHGI